MLPLLLLAPPQPGVLPEWLVGTWCTDGAEKRSCEQWTPHSGGTLAGTGYVEKSQGRTVTERMRIAIEPGGLAFYGQPEGQAAVRFAAVEASAGRIVFAAPKHDYPQRIRYWREGELLMAEVSLADGSRPQRWAYRRVK